MDSRGRRLLPRGVISSPTFFRNAQRAEHAIALEGDRRPQKGDRSDYGYSLTRRGLQYGYGAHAVHQHLAAPRSMPTFAFAVDGIDRRSQSRRRCARIACFLPRIGTWKSPQGRPWFKVWGLPRLESQASLRRALPCFHVRPVLQNHQDMASSGAIEASRPVNDSGSECWREPS